MQKKSRALWAGPVVAVLAIVAGFVIVDRIAASEAQAARAEFAAQEPAIQDADATEVELVLADYMSQINRSMRRVKRGMDDPAKLAGTLKQLTVAQESAVRGKAMTPPYAEELAAGERAEFLRNFRMTMIDLTSEMLKVEKALLKGDAAGAAKAFETMMSIQKRGHNQFQEPDE